VEVLVYCTAGNKHGVFLLLQNVATSHTIAQK